jgi:PIN domain nuclease of toxin-antitoxin system
MGLAGGRFRGFSAVSSAEAAIKGKSGKFELPDAPARYLPRRLTEQGIGWLSGERKPQL